MTPKPPTFHVQLFPTGNALEAQRSYHRLRSTRKLEAVTPLLLDLDSKGGIMPDAPTLISPRTRATRRKGHVFNSPTTPVSSTDPIESDFVFVSTHVPHSPGSSSSPSPSGKHVTHNNSGSGISGKAKTGDRNKTTKTEGPQRLAQPFLLQLRSLPVSPTRSIKAKNIPVHHPEPLSPIPSSFNMYSAPTSSHPRHVLTETQKRKKLAKLARTLGENIPPELVFHSSPPLQRTTSMLAFRPPPRSHKSSHSAAVPSSTLLPAVAPATLAAQPQPAMEPSTPVKQQRTARPQSMTLATSPTMAKPSIRGASLDHASPNDPPFQEVAVPEPKEVPDAWGKRKEKGWSGEWNVKDMTHVTKALRGLKAR